MNRAQIIANALNSAPARQALSKAMTDPLMTFRTYACACGWKEVARLGLVACPVCQGPVENLGEVPEDGAMVVWKEKMY